MFREAARPILEASLGVKLLSEVALGVGNPPKQHRFDLVATDESWILECKALVWRENGGVPQAKITSITEAAMCLRDCVNQKSKRAIALGRAVHPRRTESLGEYYARLHSHSLAGVVALIEIDPLTSSLKWLVRGNAG